MVGRKWQWNGEQNRGVFIYIKQNLYINFTHSRLNEDWDRTLRTDITHFIQRRRQWHPTPVLLPGKSHGWRSLVSCSPWGRQELDRTERLPFHFSLSCIGEGNGESQGQGSLVGFCQWGRRVGHDWSDLAVAFHSCILGYLFHYQETSLPYSWSHLVFEDLFLSEKPE